MQRATFATVLFCLGCVWGVGVTRAQPASAEGEVWATEQARADSLLQQDYKALDKILADDLVFVHSDGEVDTKTSFMTALTSGQTKYTLLEKKEASLRIMGTVAIINGEYLIKTETAGGTPSREPVDMQTTAVYAKLDGRWQLVSYQSTRKSVSGLRTAPAGR